MPEQPMDAGTTGMVKILGQLSCIAAFITAFGYMLVAWRTDMKSLLEAEVGKNQAFITALNTNNHLSAGAVNTMEKLILEIRELQGEVRALKIAKTIHTEEPPKIRDKPE